MNRYNPKIHHRRSIRLKGYDYSQSGLYFITICCQEKACMFGEIVGAHPCGRPNHECGRPNHECSPDQHHCQEIQLNDAGKMVENEWLKLPQRFGNIQLHEYVIMPNHFHGILEIMVGENVGQVQCDELIGRAECDESIGSIGRPQGHAPTVGDMMDAFKSITTVEYVHGVKTMNWQRFNGKLWQRNYYEHIIRNEESHNTISNYIINNPAKWNEDKFYII